MKITSQALLYLGLLCIVGLGAGCAVQLKPVVYTVQYESEVSCAAESKDCPWARLEEQAKFSALVNCLLSGANVLNKETSNQVVDDVTSVVVPTPPKYGYEFRIVQGDERRCKASEFVCSVASRRDNETTWAGCGTEPLGDEALRGGEDMEHADQLSKSAVVTGSLASSADAYQLRDGLDGPDHYYTFTLAKRTAVETAVGVNSSDWSPTKGHRTPWQPGLFLLTANGRKIREGHAWRAGVTYLLPLELDPGTYYLVVDSTQREFSRGDGLYRLYLGFNRNHMGAIRSK